MITFGDIDRDGMMDMVFYDEGTSSLYTFYNRQTSNGVNDNNLCREGLGNTQRSGVNSNTFYPSISDAINNASFPRSVDIQRIETDSFRTGPLVGSNEHLPGRVRLGDIDADGYPDILLTVNSIFGQSLSMIFLNSPTSNDQTTELGFNNNT